MGGDAGGGGGGGGGVPGPARTSYETLQATFLLNYVK